MLAASEVRREPVVYPETDGLPMAEGTPQYDEIVRIKEELDYALPDAFVAADLFWYPVEGQPGIRLAPDVMVALGRPKGRRGSYRQWEEGGQAPQVVFEIWSPSNTLPEFFTKLRFYERYGVQEFYLYDPESHYLVGWSREADMMREIAQMDGWTSPLLGVRFALSEEGLELFHADGRRFLRPAEVRTQLAASEARAAAAQKQAAAAQEQAAAAQARAAALEARLRAMGVEPD